MVTLLIVIETFWRCYKRKRAILQSVFYSPLNLRPNWEDVRMRGCSNVQKGGKYGFDETALPILVITDDVGKLNSVSKLHVQYKLTFVSGKGSSFLILSLSVFHSFEHWHLALWLFWRSKTAFLKVSTDKSFGVGVVKLRHLKQAQSVRRGRSQRWFSGKAGMTIPYHTMLWYNIPFCAPTYYTTSKMIFWYDHTIPYNAVPQHTVPRQRWFSGWCRDDQHFPHWSSTFSPKQPQIGRKLSLW